MSGSQEAGVEPPTVSHQRTGSRWRNALLVGLGTILTSLLTLVATNYYNHYDARARPELTVTSIGFGSPLNIQSMPLPVELLRTSSIVKTVRALRKFETFDGLRAYEAEVSQQMELLQRGVDSIQTWRDIYKGEGPSISAAAIKDHPIIQYDFLVHDIIGEVNRASADFQFGKTEPQLESDIAVLEKGPKIIAGEKMSGSDSKTFIWHILNKSTGKLS